MIDTLCPDLNVDLIAGGMKGYHAPMSEAARLKLRIERGIGFYVYDAVKLEFLYYFDSIQNARLLIRAHRATVIKCLNTNFLFVGRFVFSTELLSNYTYGLSLSLQDLQRRIERARLNYIPVQPASKTVLAENVIHPELTAVFPTITDFARAVGGNRSTARRYLNGSKGKLYLNQWKLSLVNRYAQLVVI